MLFFCFFWGGQNRQKIKVLLIFACKCKNILLVTNMTSEISKQHKNISQVEFRHSIQLQSCHPASEANSTLYSSYTKFYCHWNILNNDVLTALISLRAFHFSMAIERCFAVSPVRFNSLVHTFRSEMFWSSINSASRTENWKARKRSS